MNNEPRSCATCDEVACGMHQRLRLVEAPAERVAWVLDDVWPETASLVAAMFGDEDQLIAPGVLGAWPERYRWPFRGSRAGSLATARRHWAMWRVRKASGAVRQRTYLDNDRWLGCQLAKAVDYRATHLMVAQSWLPWLDEAGALGGRSFDVIMSRYPFGEIHRLLDEAATEIGPSATIADFRAPAELVEREADLLAKARQLYTPHSGIARLFPKQAVHLAWHKPMTKRHKFGTRTAFLGPTIARNRPDIARRMTANLEEPIVVFGPLLEPMWDGIPIERRERNSHWLDGIGSILHPATVTHQPRALLEALAAGVVVYATETCGLERSDYLSLDEFPSNAIYRKA